MSEGCIAVSVEGGCGSVSVEDPGIPDIAIGCCEQGPPGPPRPGQAPFYLSDGTASFVSLLSSKIPFYLSDGTPAFMGIV